MLPWGASDWERGARYGHSPDPPKFSVPFFLPEHTEVSGLAWLMPGCEGQVGARQGQPFLDPWLTVAARGIGSGHGRHCGVMGPSRGLRPRSESLLFGHICPLQPPDGFQAINPSVWPCESWVRRGS